MKKFNRFFMLSSFAVFAVARLTGLSDLPAYTDYQWKNINLQQWLGPETALDLDSGIATDGINGYGIEIGVDKKYRVLVWNLNTGSIVSHSPVFEKVFGLAWDYDEKRLLVRTSKSIEIMDARLQSVIKSFAFPKANSWRDITYLDKKVFEINGERDGLNVYQINDLQLAQKYPVPEGKLQRIFVKDRENLVLWSSFWKDNGNPRVFSLKDGVLGAPIIMAPHYKGLFQAAVSPELDGEAPWFFLANSSNKYTGRARIVGQTMVVMDANTQVDKSGLGFRYDPLTQTLEAHLSPKAKPGVGDGRFLLLLPIKEAYHQEILSEKYRGDLVGDPFGNRYLLVDSSIATDEPAYTAQIKRWNIAFDLPKSKAKLEVPAGFERYLNDNPILMLTDPLVVATSKKVLAGADSIAEKMIAVHRFAMSIDGVWDGKADLVPQVIRNMHGGCNEHTRVQLAFLRLAGIPCRYVWNFLSHGKEDGIISIDHAIAEAWLPQTGWVPLEGLGRTYGKLDPYVLFEVGAPENRPYQPRLAKGQLSLTSLNDQVDWQFSDEKRGN